MDPHSGTSPELRERQLQENKQKALSLIDKAENLIKIRDFSTGASQAQSLRLEWKTSVHPLPRDESEWLWHSFDTAINHFFDSKSSENETKAERLIEKAIEIASSTEWRTTAKKLSDLRYGWKSIHPLPKETEEELWSRFNDAINGFYTARERHYIEKTGELLDEADQLSDSTEWEPTLRKFTNIAYRLREFLPLPQDIIDSNNSRLKKAEARFNIKRLKAEAADIEAFITASEDHIDKLAEQIDTLSYTNFKRKDELESYIDDIEDEIEKKESCLAEITKELERLETIVSE